MKRLLITSVIVGVIAGFLVGGFYNLFMVPVMERAIDLEEQRSASVTPSDAEDEGGAEVSLGVQRIGMVLGTAIYGAILGLFFSAGFVLLHRAAPRLAGGMGGANRRRVGLLEPFPVSIYQISPQPPRRRRRGDAAFPAVGAGAVYAAFRRRRRRGTVRRPPHQRQPGIDGRPPDVARRDAGGLRGAGPDNGFRFPRQPRPRAGADRPAGAFPRPLRCPASS